MEKQYSALKSPAEVPRGTARRLGFRGDTLGDDQLVYVFLFYSVINDLTGEIT